MLKRSFVNSSDASAGISASQSNHFVDTRAGVTTPMDSHQLPLSPERPQHKLAVSNLTRNLLSSASSGTSNFPPDPPSAQTATPEPSFTRQPPPYSASATLHNSFIPVASFSSHQSQPASASSSFNPGVHFTNVHATMPSFTPPTNNMNYLPLGHNTPTVVSSSYTSSHSLTPSFMGNQTFGNDIQAHAQYQPRPVSALSGSYKAPGMPTTNLSMDSANVYTAPAFNRVSLNRNNDSSVSSHYGGVHQGTYVSSLPNSFVESSSIIGNSSQNPIQKSSAERAHKHQLANDTSQHLRNQELTVKEAPQACYAQSNVLITGPDHYMSYSEYLSSLNSSNANLKEGDESGYEDHLNIVDYPVDKLINMLACLLTKIIEANDKLHPNHFDATISSRKKSKEHKKMKKMEKDHNAQLAREHTRFSCDGINTTVSHIAEGEISDESSEEEDELKNKYLANVLAFHGTNVPGITLHAYLTRVLKYCPVTNEVFLSLLVYFDRIAKRANHFQNKKATNSDDNSAEEEQIFVMDSFNIHRLIISGITVSSKFFSDIFYKNLRYAKVGGLPLEELNYLELQFLLLLDFKLMISVEDLQNYGDLLLKFWKREQLASEIVSGGAPN